MDDEDGSVSGAAGGGGDMSLFNSETVGGTTFSFYLMHNANVLGH